MVKNSNIEWTHHTFNPWIGCTKVSPGCDHCYAETQTARFKTVEWGAGKPRVLTSDSYWKQPIAWNKEARASGVSQRVFCASLADVFDNEVDPAWRVRLFDLIAETPYLDWLLLTKRISNAAKMLPDGWNGGWQGVWIGISVVNQEEADRDIPKLLRLPAITRFLSIEPLLGNINLDGMFEGVCIDCIGAGEVAGDYFSDDNSARCASCHGRGRDPDNEGISWVIVGGESGKEARPMHPDWVKHIRDQCQAGGVPFLFKQWGEWLPFQQGVGYMRSPIKEARIIAADGNPPNRNGTPVYNVGKKAAGRELDGREWNEYPTGDFR